MDALEIAFAGFFETLGTALAPLRELATPLKSLTEAFSSANGTMQSAAQAFRTASAGGNANSVRNLFSPSAAGNTNGNKPPDTAGATQGQVDRALQSFEQQFAKLPAALGGAAAGMKPEIDRITQIFSALQKSSAGLASGTDRGFAELQRALGKLGSVKSADDLSKIGDQLLTAVEKVRRAGGEAATLDLSIFGKFSYALAAASKNLASMLTNPLAGLSRGINAAATPTAKAAGGMAGAIGGITSAVLGPLQGLTGAVGSFVQALNPGLMKVFNQALRDLMATFGTAFTPIIKGVTALFNELSATLAPAMHALVPIIDNLMSVLEGVFIPVIGIIADAFVALSPIIEFVTSIMASVAEAMRVVYTVFRSAIQVLSDVLKQVFGGVDLKGAAQGIQQVIQQLTKYFVQFAAYVAKALGYLDPFAKALEKNLNDLKGQRPGQKAAPENARVSGLEQISKDLAIAAYAAQAAAGGKKKSDEAMFLEELIKQVEEVKKNGKTLQKFLDELMVKLKNGLVSGFSTEFKAALAKLWKDFLEWWKGGDKGGPQLRREGVDPVHRGERRANML